MFCISCHTLSDLLFYHLDHLVFNGQVFLFRSYELIDNILYLTFQIESELSFSLFICSSDDGIIFDLIEVD